MDMTAQKILNIKSTVKAEKKIDELEEKVIERLCELGAELTNIDNGHTYLYLNNMTYELQIDTITSEKGLWVNVSLSNLGKETEARVVISGDSTKFPFSLKDSIDRLFLYCLKPSINSLNSILNWQFAGMKSNTCGTLLDRAYIFLTGSIQSEIKFRFSRKQVGSQRIWVVEVRTPRKKYEFNQGNDLFALIREVTLFVKYTWKFRRINQQVINSIGDYYSQDDE